jgi:hypothetical protein
MPVGRISHKEIADGSIPSAHYRYRRKRSLRPVGVAFKGLDCGVAGQKDQRQADEGVRVALCVGRPAYSPWSLDLHSWSPRQLFWDIHAQLGYVEEFQRQDNESRMDAIYVGMASHALLSYVAKASSASLPFFAEAPTTTLARRWD